MCKSVRREIGLLEAEKANLLFQLDCLSVISNAYDKIGHINQYSRTVGAEIDTVLEQLDSVNMELSYWYKRNEMYITQLETDGKLYMFRHPKQTQGKVNSCY